MTERETQHATVEVNIAFPVDEDAENIDRIQAANHLVKEVIETASGIEYRGVRGATELGRVETAEETAERKMAEAESAAAAKAERAYERYLEERGSRYR